MIMYLYICNIIICLYYYIYILYILLLLEIEPLRALKQKQPNLIRANKPRNPECLKLPPYPLYNTSILLIFLNPKPSIEDVVQDRTCSKALGLIIG